MVLLDPTGIAYIAAAVVFTWIALATDRSPSHSGPRGTLLNPVRRRHLGFARTRIDG